MDVKKGQTMDRLWEELRRTRGSIARAAEIAGVTVLWVRTIVRDRKYQNEKVVLACIQAIKEVREEKKEGLQDYLGKMDDLITKELQANEPPTDRSKQTDPASRHPAVAG